MTRAQAIDLIGAKLDLLTDAQLADLAAIADPLTRGISNEDDATRAAIAEGIAQADRDEFATDVQVATAFARFRS